MLQRPLSPRQRALVPLQPALLPLERALSSLQRALLPCYRPLPPRGLALLLRGRGSKSPHPGPESPQRRCNAGRVVKSPAERAELMRVPASIRRVPG
jgi:hypothetical protein